MIVETREQKLERLVMREHANAPRRIPRRRHAWYGKVYTSYGETFADVTAAADFFDVWPGRVVQAIYRTTHHRTLMGRLLWCDKHVSKINATPRHTWGAVCSERGERWDTVDKAAAALKTSRSGVSQCLNRRRRSAKGRVLFPEWCPMYPPKRKGRPPKPVVRVETGEVVNDRRVLIDVDDVDYRTASMRFFRCMRRGHRWVDGFRYSIA